MLHTVVDSHSAIMYYLYDHASHTFDFNSFQGLIHSFQKPQHIQLHSFLVCMHRKLLTLIYVHLQACDTGDVF